MFVGLPDDLGELGLTLVEGGVQILERVDDAVEPEE